MAEVTLRAGWPPPGCRGVRHGEGGVLPLAGGMTVYGGLEFADAPEQVLLPLAVALLECLVAPAMLGLYLRVAAAVGCEDLARLPGFLGGRLPVEFLAGYPVDVGEVPAPGGSGAPGDLHLAEELEMLNGHLDRGDAAGVDGVGYLPVGRSDSPWSSLKWASAM